MANVEEVSVESTIHGSANWYQVSLSSRIIGTNSPSAVSAAFGIVPTLTVVPAARAKACTSSAWVTVVLGTCHGRPQARSSSAIATSVRTTSGM